jgi:hypothetical protein
MCETHCCNRGLDALVSNLDARQAEWSTFGVQKSKQRPKIREENKMSETVSPNEALDNAYEVIGMPTDKRTRDARKLRWYERQYGAGFVSGFWVGIAVGFPLAAGVAAVCKVFVTWLFTFS